MKRLKMQQLINPYDRTRPALKYRLELACKAVGARDCTTRQLIQQLSEKLSLKEMDLVRDLINQVARPSQSNIPLPADS